MKQFAAKNIKNIALLGHGGSGKTTLAEAMLFFTGATERLGRVADGTTVCDYDPEEVKRKTSVSLSIAPVLWKSDKLNILDCPGLFDFEGGVFEGLRGADTGLITVSGKSGLTVGAVKAYRACEKAGKAKMIFVNKLNSESADFYKVFESLKATFGPSVCPLVVPYVEERKVVCYISLLEYKAFTYQDGKATACPIPDLGARLDGLRTAMYEAVAETSDELFEKYFSGETFTPEELILGLSKGVRSGTVTPVFCGAGQTMEGLDLLLNGLAWLAPGADAATETAHNAKGEEVTLSVDESAPTAAVVFKTIADPYVGKLSYFKVISGKVESDSQLMNPRTESMEKISKVMVVRGKKQEDAAYIGAGDIGAVAKLSATNTGDTLCAPGSVVRLAPVQFPKPTLDMAVLPEKKGDEEKIVQGIHRLLEEEPTLAFTQNAETHQMVLSGLGDQHLDMVVSKLKSKFGVGVTLQTPKVPYRETIRKKVQVEGKHKKQTGGHGQYGHVWIEFEPCDSEDMVFEERVVGGSVPKGFFPAVEKGLRESMMKGTLAGFPMVGVKATLYDGSYHPVDSSEMAFKTAASIAMRNGIPQAAPCLLEPIGSLCVFVPDDMMGDIIGEINKKRGRVLGMEGAEDGLQSVTAEVPMAEMGDFTNLLRSVTQGRGSFTLSFDHYEEAPEPVAAKIIEQAKAQEEQNQ